MWDVFCVIGLGLELTIGSGGDISAAPPDFGLASFTLNRRAQGRVLRSLAERLRRIGILAGPDCEHEPWAKVFGPGLRFLWNN